MKELSIESVANNTTNQSRRTVSIKNVGIFANSFYLMKIKHLLNQNDLSLDSLDAFLKGNIGLKTKIYDELILRGILKNTYFLNNYDSKYIIRVLNDQQRFLKIQFTEFGLVDQVLKFRIMNDMFFDGIDIRSFRRYYKELNVEKFKIHLYDLGFSFQDTVIDTIKESNKNASALIPKSHFLSILFRLNLDENPYIRQYYDFIIRSETKLKINQDMINSFFKLILLPDSDITALIPTKGNKKLYYYFNENGINKISQIKMMDIINISNRYGNKQTQNLIEYLLKIDSKTTTYSSDEMFHFIRDTSQHFQEITLEDIKYFELKHYQNPVRIDEFKRAQVNSLIELYKSSSSKPGINDLVDFIDYIYLSSYLTKHYSVNKLHEFILSSHDDVHEDAYETLFSFPVFRKHKDRLKSLVIIEIEPLSFNTFVENIEYSFTEREIIVLRESQKKTLQEIGGMFELTRERIRQIERKLSVKIDVLLKKEQAHLLQEFTNISKGKGFISEYQLDHEIKEELHATFYSLDFSVINIRKSKHFKIYYHGTKDLDKVIDALLKSGITDRDSLRNQLQLEFNIDFDVCLTDEFIFNQLNEIGFYSKSFGFTVTKPSLKEKLGFIVKEYKSGINIRENTEDFIERFNQEFTDEHIINDRDVLRRIDARLMENNEIMQLGTYHYIHIDNFTINQEHKNLVEQTLNEQLSEKDSVTSAYIFSKYKESLVGIGIESKHAFYNIVKKIYGNQFHYGKANTMVISKDEDILKFTFKERLENYIEKQSIPVNKKQIMNDLSLNHESNMLDEIYQCEKLVLIGDLVYYKRAFNEYLNIIHLMEHEIDKLFEHQKIISCNVLLHGFLSNININGFLREFKIDDGMKLRQILVQFTKYNSKGASILIKSEHKGYANIIDYIVENYSIINKNEIMQLLESLMYSSANISKILDEIRSTPKLIRISNDEFAVFENLKAIDSISNQVLDYIENQLENERFISTKHFRNFRTSLPEIGIKWTHYLIGSIALRYGYHQVERKYSNFWIDAFIISKDISIKDFIGLFEYVFKKDNLNKKHISDVLKHFISLDVLDPNADKLPAEVFESNKFTLDEFNRISPIELETNHEN